MSILLGGGNNSRPISTIPPSVGAIRLQSSQYGGVLPLAYGRSRVSGNIIWYANFIATPHTEETRAGGKGGQDVVTTAVSYTYTADMIMAVCEGPITGITTVWRGKDKKAFSAAKLQLKKGTDPQAAWEYVATAVGQFVDTNGFPITSGLLLAQATAQYATSGTLPPGIVLKDPLVGQMAYAGVASVLGASYDLLNSGELPNHSFEVAALFSGPRAGIQSARVDQVVRDFLTNSVHGVGYPAAKLGSLEVLRNYTEAASIYISPVLTEQRPAHDTLRDWLVNANCEGFFSEGLLKFATYGDATINNPLTGEVFTPDLTPLYDLTDDDYLADQHDPVSVRRRMQADAYNQVQIECLDSAAAYNVTMITVDDAANVSAYGVRAMSAIKAHEFTSPAAARRVAQRRLQRSLYIRNTYAFTVGVRYSLVEPMDLLTLTDAGLGLVRKLVRVLSTEETESGAITMEAEETLAGTAESAQYATQGGAGFEHDYNVSPGNTHAPVLFEAPMELAVNGLEIWLAVSGGYNWAGCDVWVSNDDLNYQRAGIINGSARYGEARSAVALQSATDNVTQLELDITVSAGTLSSAGSTQPVARATLCYLGGEFISYRTATLTSLYHYTLSGLMRGLYGSPIAAHAAAAPFVRCDAALFSYPFDESMIGSLIYVKLLSFNQYGSAHQSLGDVTPTTYLINGTALRTPLGSIADLSTVYRDGRLYLHWTRYVDAIGRPITYIVRKGTALARSAIIAITTDPEFLVNGDDTYWVSAKTSLAESATPVAITVTGSRIAVNVVQTWDEHATGYTGTLSGGASVVAGKLQLIGSGSFSSIPTVSAVSPTINGYGGIATSGSYEIPAGHIVDVGTVQACNVSAILAFQNVDVFSLFSSLPLLSTVGSVAGLSADYGDITIQIATSDLAGTFGGWQNFVPGQYVGRKFKLRLLLTSNDSHTTPSVTAFSFTVDMPDKIYSGTNVALAAIGTAVVFTAPFQVVPNVQVTILNSVGGDTVIFLAGPTAAGFTLQITNLGIGVVRNVNWLAKGY